MCEVLDIPAGWVQKILKGRQQFPSSALITYIQSDLYFSFGLIDDSFGAREYIFRDYSPANVFAE